jgi:hypothetical protein
MPQTKPAPEPRPPSPTINPYGEWEPCPTPPGATPVLTPLSTPAPTASAERPLAPRRAAPSRWLAWAVEHDRAWRASVRAAAVEPRIGNDIVCHRIETPDSSGRRATGEDLTGTVR